jgi:hypothetical protein
MNTMKTPLQQQQFATALKVQTTEAIKQYTIIQARLIQLGFGEYCGRCGGSGHYSFNLRDGTICFGCAGSGWVARKLTAKLLAEITAIGDDKLAAAIEEITERTRLRKAATNAAKRVLDTWSATDVSKAYKWTNAYKSSHTYSERDEYIADTFNKPMHDLYKAVEQESAQVAWMSQRLATRDPELLAAQRTLVEHADAAVVSINALAEQLRSFLAA